MKVLIVDDDETKIKSIQDVVNDTLINIRHETLIAKNIADAMTFLLKQNKIELLILDLNIPVRNGENIKKLAGIKLLEEITRRNKICKPEHIIGLTAYKKEEISSKKQFRNEGWVLVHYNNKTNEWEKSISNKLTYILNKSSLAVTEVKKETILFVASSPIDQSALNAGIEQRKIEEMLSSSTFRDRFTFISKPGAKLQTLTGELMKAEPHYLHFTGHGILKGIVMENDEGETVLIPDAALNQLLGLITTLKCVILSACHSFQQAEAISKLGFYVIGMNDSVGVDAATEFSKGFYQAIGEGKDIETSFKFGLVHLTANDESQKTIPELWLMGNKI